MNTLCFEGNLAADPEYRENADSASLSFRVLESRSRKTEQGREDIDPNAYDVKLLGKRATMFKDVYKKGMRVLVVGGIAPNNYESNDGTKNRSFTVFADTAPGIVPFNCDVVYTPKPQDGV